MALGPELGAEIFIVWVGARGVETDVCPRADETVKRLGEAVNYQCD